MSFTRNARKRANLRLNKSSELVEQMERRDEGPALSEAVCESARKGILPFTRANFRGNYRVNWHHVTTANVIDQWIETPNIKNLMLFMPPRHGKSELGTRNLPAYLLGRFPDDEVILATHTLQLARNMSLDTRRIVRGERYRSIFPGTMLPPSGTGESIGYQNTTTQWDVFMRNGSYQCAGVGSSLNGEGGDWLIADDLIGDDEKAQSQNHRDKVWNWWQRVFSERGSERVKKMLIMTRWHADDVAGRLLRAAQESEHAEDWHVLMLQALKTDRVDHPDDPRQEGEALWEWRRDRRYWLGKQAVDPEGFSALGQQEPAPPGGLIIKSEWLQNRYDLLPNFMRGRWFQSWDMKHGSTDPKSSYVVGQLWFQPWNQPANLYLVDQKRDRWGTADSIDLVYRLATQDPLWKRAGTKLVEKKADGVAVLDILKHRVPGLVEHTPRGRSKEMRYKAVAGIWRAGNIYLPENAPFLKGVDGFINEHVKAPRHTYDDQIDASTQIIEHVLIPDDDQGGARGFYQGWFDDDD